ncbi:hypothetical protein F478_00513, partial [Pseudomonas sp. URIL14HWK12:I2]
RLGYRALRSKSKSKSKSNCNCNCNCNCKPRALQDVLQLKLVL